MADAQASGQAKRDLPHAIVDGHTSAENQVEAEPLR